VGDAAGGNADASGRAARRIIQAEDDRTAYLPMVVAWLPRLLDGKRSDAERSPLYHRMAYVRSGHELPHFASGTEMEAELMNGKTFQQANGDLDVRPRSPRRSSKVQISALPSNANEG
jgi:hypothetical protein